MLNEEVDLEFEVESTPLEEALTKKELEEISEDDIELINFGLAPNYAESFRQEYKDKKIFWQGIPTNGFIEYYLDRCTPEEVRAIEFGKLSETQQEMVQKALNETEEELIEGKGDQILTPNRTDLDKAYKKIAHLQQSRDKSLKLVKKRVEERDKYRKAFKELLDIFIDQEIKANVSDRTWSVAEELLAEEES